MKIGCVVMAAGKGRRFGANKLLAPLEGRPLLEHVLDTLPKERFAKILAVVSSPDTAAFCRKKGVDCLYYPGGPQSETVRRGIQQMEGMDGCLFVLGDQPLCTAASLRNLLDAFEAKPDTVHRLCFDGRPGSPAVFPRRLFPALACLCGDQGGMAAAKGEPVDFVEASFAAELWDADTPEMLAHIQDYLHKKRHSSL